MILTTSLLFLVRYCSKYIPLNNPDVGICNSLFVTGSVNSGTPVMLIMVTSPDAAGNFTFKISPDLTGLGKYSTGEAISSFMMVDERDCEPPPLPPEIVWT